MMNTLNLFEEYMLDDSASDMYITGPAGTGKTTDLRRLIEYCNTLSISYVVCAYTHKACGILATKLPPATDIQTLHKWLKKRPAINEHATNIDNVTTNIKAGKSDIVRVVFIDEYSFVGERDYLDIVAMQDLAEEQLGCPIKIVWLGDSNQLPPVGDAQAIVPYGKYKVQLTKIHRQAGDNPLLSTLTQLVNFIQAKEATELLITSDKFIRGQDIVEEYKADTSENKALLAFTNEKVEELNAAVQGRSEPEPGDVLFSPTTKLHYQFVEWVEPTYVTYIEKPFGGPLMHGSKFKTLEFLLAAKMCKFAKVYELDSEETEPYIIACVFGHYQYKLALEETKSSAASSNAQIEQAHDTKAAAWAKENAGTKLAKSRSKAWRKFLTFNDCIACLDFTHAMTVHRSQGSTYENVYVDTNDLYKCAHNNFVLYLKLMYVAISRASNKVVTT